jgi:type VI secretion system secreted protein Hcp
MALNAYLKIKGQKQGDIKGSATVKGREGRIVVIACSHDVVSARDPASGQATGKRQHHPLLITKELDKSSVPLRQALVMNENLTLWDLQFWRAMTRGSEKQHFTIRLVNAQVASIHFELPNTRSPDTSKLPELEQISFVYEKIEWIWTDGLVAEDDWEASLP